MGLEAGCESLSFPTGRGILLSPQQGAVVEKSLPVVSEVFGCRRRLIES